MGAWEKKNGVSPLPPCSLAACRREGKISYVEYRGAIHIHSVHSDGSGTVSEIVEAGQRSSVDFVVITDHNTLAAKADEGWHEDVLVLVGQEAAQSRRHCIVLGVDRPIHRDQPMEEVFEKVAAQGGLSFIVHPHGRLRPIFKLTSFAWERWEINGYTGIEIWSYMFDWIKDFRLYKWWRFWNDPDEHILGPFPKTLMIWDELCQSRRVVGIGGLDVHARKFVFGAFEVFPYEWMFRRFSTHILAREPFSGRTEEDIRLVLEALGSGRCFIGYDLLGLTDGFRFEVATDRTLAVMGDELPWEEGLDLEVHVPRPAHIRILCDGQEVMTKQDACCRLRLERAGVYRAEVCLDGRPWIFSNPIYVRRRQEAGDRRQEAGA